MRRFGVSRDVRPLARENAHLDERVSSQSRGSRKRQSLAEDLCIVFSNVAFLQ
jgi:hypothetical protein